MTAQDSSSKQVTFEAIEALKPGVIEAIEAFFAMDAAIRVNELTIGDLAEGLALAIDGPRQGNDGHDMAMITTMMMFKALGMDRDSLPCTT